MSRLFAVLLALLLTAPPALALTAQEVLTRVDRNLEPESSEMYRKLINIEPDGDKKEFVLYSVRKGRDKMVALFLAPASEKGRASLRLDDNMWLYIPSVGKPIRITSLQSVVGGVFNNSDILRLDYSTEYEPTKMEETGVGYLLDLKAKTAAVAYDRLKMTVDKKALVPTRIECYAASGLLIKTLYYKEIKDFGGGIVRPSVLETDSPLYKGYKSMMLWASIKKRTLADEVFTLNYPAPGGRAAMRRRLGQAVVLLFCLLPGPLRAEEEFHFDAAAFEKKSLEWGGYAELKAEHSSINQDGALSRLNLYREPRSTLDRLGATLQLDGRFTSKGSPASTGSCRPPRFRTIWPGTTRPTSSKAMPASRPCPAPPLILARKLSSGVRVMPGARLVSSTGQRIPTSRKRRWKVLSAPDLI